MTFNLKELHHSWKNRTRADGWDEMTEYSPRTDLAVEAHELVRGREKRLNGIEEVREQVEEGITVSRVHVKTVAAEKRMGKRKGHYITIEAPGLRRHDPELQEKVSALLAREFEQLLKPFKLSENASVLVVGLGNSHVTPDALGPEVVDRVFVTRHLFRYMPEAMEAGYRSVSAVSPGVLGITGIETSEIVRGIVSHVKPDLVIAIDALATRSLERVNATVQISDTGIQPGAGVGNRRQALDEETLGVPCIAVGVPTVVDAATVASDAMELILKQLESSVPGNGANQVFDQFAPREKWQMIREVLDPLGNNLMVTPKEIDEFIDDTAHVVAQGINCALHPSLTMEEAEALTR